MAMVTLKGLQGGRTLAGSRNMHALTQETPQLKQQTQQKKMHQVVGPAPMAGPAHIAMPPNVAELQASEKARFSPRRNRDVSSKLNQVGGVFGSRFMGSQVSQGTAFNNSSLPVDSHSDKYDTRITVSLSSVMQTNVPKPYEISGKAPVHLNMPGGQWAQDEKYISGDLHTFHHSNISSRKNPGTANRSLSLAGLGVPVGRAAVPRVTGSNPLFGGGAGSVDSVNCIQLLSTANKVRLLSNKVSASEYLIRLSPGCKFFHKSAVTNTQQSQDTENKKTDTPESQLTPRQKLQRAVKEYGATVIVFHVTISLASLGICYLLVSSGVDMTGIIKSLGINLGQVGEGAADTPSLAEASAVGGLEQDSSSSEAPGPTADDSNAVEVNTRRAAGAATFVVAYAVHKVFAPARIAVTLTATPFIVRHLRKIGFLKPPKAKVS